MIRRISSALTLLTGLILYAGALPAQASVIIVVRHAEKSTTGGSDPALSAAGQTRADALAEVLRDTRIEHVLVTEFRRTSETAAPLLHQRQLTAQHVDIGSQTVPAHAQAVAAALDALPAGSAVLVVGHSNTVPPIVAALGGPSMPDLPDDEFSALFIVTRVPGQPARVMRARYGSVAISPTQ